MSQLPFTPSSSAAILVVPVASVSEWITVVSNANITDTLMDGVIRRAKDISTSTRPVFSRVTSGGVTLGTALRLRASYEYGGEQEGTPSPVRVRVFAGNDPEVRSSFVPIRNANGDLSVVIPCDVETDPIVFTTDSVPEPPLQPVGRCVTTPDNNAHTWDCMGYSHFIVGLELSMTGVAGAEVEARID